MEFRPGRKRLSQREAYRGTGRSRMAASSLPAPVAMFARTLPSDALAEAMRVAIVGGRPPSLGMVAVLVGWGAVGAIIAGRTFRWS